MQSVRERQAGTSNLYYQHTPPQHSETEGKRAGESRKHSKPEGGNAKLARPPILLSKQSAPATSQPERNYSLALVPSFCFVWPQAPLRFNFDDDGDNQQQENGNGRTERFAGNKKATEREGGQNSTHSQLTCLGLSLSLSHCAHHKKATNTAAAAAVAVTNSGLDSQ